jgi:aspartate/methionine/tyrosine aminotransferase
MRNFELEIHFSKWEFKAKYHMTASDSESMSMEDLLAMGSSEDVSKFNKLWLGYTETWGAADLREVIASTYDTLSAENILCFAGAEEGVYAAMRVILSKDDHAIVVVPNYQAAETIPLDICEVSGVPLQSDNNWFLDINEIAKAIKPNTKLVSINFPNNPTGAIIPEKSMMELVELCRKHDLYLFSDEVYRLIETKESNRITQAADLYEKGISLNVCSKAYGLPGIRIGWIGCQDIELLQALERYKHYLSICNSGPSERLAVIALKNRDKILERNRALLKSNLSQLDKFFCEYPNLFEWTIPDGGCVGYPRFIGRGGVENFCHRLIEEVGILLLPSSIYKSELLEAPTDRFRIGYGRKNLDLGLEVFREFLNKTEL